MFFVEQKIKRQNTNVQQRMKWWGGAIMVVLEVGRNIGAAAKTNSHLLIKLNEGTVNAYMVRDSWKYCNNNLKNYFMYKAVHYYSVIMLDKSLGGLEVGCRSSRRALAAAGYQYVWEKGQMLQEHTGKEQAKLQVQPKKQLCCDLKKELSEFYVKLLKRGMKLGARKLSPAAWCLLCSRKMGFNIQFSVDCTDEILDSIISSSSWENKDFGWILDGHVGQKSHTILFQ